LGERGERAAERFVRRLGYTIVARRQRGRLGELDLVAVDDRTVVFIEVKTRRTHDAGHPAEAVGPDKQRRLTRLALAFLKRHDLLENAARFDVLAITWPETSQRPTIEHFKNAFDAVGRGQMFS
jgi:putative endonuclease